MSIPVLLIPGAGGGAWQWRDWEPVLAQNGLATEAIDLLPSDQGLAATRFEDYVGQLEAWFDATQSSSPHAPAAVGASLGGLLALKLAETRPVSALVLVNPAPPAAVFDWSGRECVYPEIVHWADGLDLERTKASMPEADQGTVRWAHSQWRDESGLVMQAVSNGVSTSPPDCPCLVLCSADDATVPRSVCAETARTLGAQTHCFEGVSHVGALLGAYSTILAQEAAGWLTKVLGGNEGH